MTARAQPITDPYDMRVWDVRAEKIKQIKAKKKKGWRSKTLDFQINDLDWRKVIKIDYSRNALMTEKGLETMALRYYLKDETDPQHVFARVACAGADDEEHAQRLYDYISLHWFMPATPVLTNMGANRGLPISCFLQDVDDTLDSIAEGYEEFLWMAARGGGVGTYWGGVRSVGEAVGVDGGETSGIIPFVKIEDSLSLGISQGSIRRGAAAVYLDITHPEIEEFMEIRKPSGDFNRKSLNLHNGVVITDEFMEAVRDDKEWWFVSPRDGSKRPSSITGRPVRARDLFQKLVELRLSTGEPYLYFKDNVNRNRPLAHKKLGLKSKTSNLCLKYDTKVTIQIDGKEQTVTMLELHKLWSNNRAQINDRKEIKVRCRDHALGEDTWGLVSASKMMNANAQTVAVTDSGTGARVICTPDHKFAVAQQGTDADGDHVEYIQAADLKRDSQLFIQTDEGLMLSTAVEVTDSANATVYDITVEEYHNFYADGVLVHNCIEITLPTGEDHLGEERSAVCCLSSLNLVYWDDWKDNRQFFKDVFMFLDNTMETFINRAPEAIGRAIYAAWRERSVGCGVMGFHSYLQERNIPMESALTKSLNMRMFKGIYAMGQEINTELAHERGPCPDSIDADTMQRFIHMFAIAPTASISVVAGGASACIEPIPTNAYNHKTLSGTHTIKNSNLERVLEELGQNTKQVWNSILEKGGSVQHLDFLDENTRFTFKNAEEIDQRWLLELAADRTPYVCQSTSLNLFVPANIHKWDLLMLHYKAWELGIKSLYYLRSQSIQRAHGAIQIEGRGDVSADNTLEHASVMVPEAYGYTDYNECMACQ